MPYQPKKDPFTAPILDPSVNYQSQCWLVEQYDCDEVMLNRVGADAVALAYPWQAFSPAPNGYYPKEMN